MVDTEETFSVPFDAEVLILDLTVENTVGRRPSPGTSVLFPVSSTTLSMSDSPSWSLEASIGDVNTSNTTFKYTVEVVDAVLEEYGISLFLTRSFQWSKGKELQIWLRGDASVQFVYLWNVDVRIGTI